jgi:hypothetical protein
MLFFQATKIGADKLYRASMLKGNGGKNKKMPVVGVDEDVVPKRKAKPKKRLTVDQIKRKEKLVRQKTQLKQMEEVMELPSYTNAVPPNFSSNNLTHKSEAHLQDEQCCKVI